MRPAEDDSTRVCACSAGFGRFFCSFAAPASPSGGQCNGGAGLWYFRRGRLQIRGYIGRKGVVMDNEFNFFDLLLVAFLEEIVRFLVLWFRSFLEGIF
jgi:hypothetical protein